jgi:photosystem II stability/assembly factor-like uncharacterized protein
VAACRLDAQLLLAWPAADVLLRLDPGGEPQALTAVDPRTLYAALLDGTVKRSTDGGSTWTDTVVPPG